MKTLGMIVLLMMSCPTSPHSGVVGNKTIDRIYAHMKGNNNKIGEKEGMGIAASIYFTSQKYNLDWKLLSAITMQESGYRIGACRNAQKRAGGRFCSDYGLAQIHVNNVRALNLNKELLLSSPSYNLDVAGKILKDFRSRFGTKRAWWVHYHAGNRVNTEKHIYRKLVLRYY